MRKILAVIAALFIGAPAYGQQNYVKYSPPITIGHLPYWAANGVLLDAGSAIDSAITSIGVTNNGQSAICVNSARKASGAYNALCLGASTTGPATISLQNYGTASAQSLQFNINGTVQGFPTVTPLPVVIGDHACFSTTAGGLTDCGTAPGNEPFIIGTTPIQGASSGGVLYNNAGKAGSYAITGTGNAVLSASPTFTGTVTFPDSATWASTGISKVSALSVGSATLPSSGNVSISGQYQVNGTQIAASNLSNGTTGTGSVVLAAGPTLSGTVAGSITLSGNDTFTAQGIFQGTSAPSSAAGNTVVMGTLAAPTLANTGQAFLYNTTVNGAVLQGDGSTYDSVMTNKTGGVAVGVATGTTTPVLPGLASGTCTNNLAINSSNQVITVPCQFATATLQASPSNPSNLTNASFLMEGFGSTCHITPSFSGRLHVSFNFDMESGTAAVSLNTKVMYGTGTAPSNAAAVTGTQVGNIHNTVQAVGADFASITHGAYIITGLTPGTAYWLDIAAQGDGTHALAIANTSCSAMEF